jgi:hypothetical protein
MTAFAMFLQRIKAMRSLSDVIEIFGRLSDKASWTRSLKAWCR